MKLRDILDFRAFAEVKTLLATIKSSEEFDGDEEVLKNATPVMAFESSKQRNWLFVTNKKIYCVLDDKQKTNPRVRWSVPISKMSNLNIQIGEYSANSGVITLDEDKTLLYSKRFFYDLSPIERIDNIKRKKVG